MPGSDALTVATLPARHAYVDAVTPPDVVRVSCGRPPDLGWAPDPLWDPAVLAARGGDADVVHVHFGFDDVDPGRLRSWCDVARRGNRRLVVTVHDLRNPHHLDRSRHDAQLHVLVPAADRVLTLTGGAAAAIHARWGVPPAVVAHPAVFDGPAAVDLADGSGPPVVGLHLKSLRANVRDPAAVVAVLLRASAAAGARLRVDAHDDVVDRPELLAVRRLVAGAPHAVLDVHPRFDDDQLQAYLTGLTVSVVANRWGTHSGWVEACHDVGTRVVAPDCGFYAEQWPEAVVYRNDETDGLDPHSLYDATTTAIAAGRPRPADRSARARSLAAVHAVHRAAYA